MRALLLASACLILATPVMAAPTSGPFVGTVGQDGANAHAYSSYVGNCLDVYMPRHYTVTLEYAPITDVLTVSARGVSATGSNGHASIGFIANSCTSFTITVGGASVADSATYAVEVVSTAVVPNVVS